MFCKEYYYLLIICSLKLISCLRLHTNSRLSGKFSYCFLLNISSLCSRLLISSFVERNSLHPIHRVLAEFVLIWPQFWSLQNRSQLAELKRLSNIWKHATVGVASVHRRWLKLTQFLENLHDSVARACRCSRIGIVDAENSQLVIYRLVLPYYWYYNRCEINRQRKTW